MTKPDPTPLELGRMTWMELVQAHADALGLHEAIDGCSCPIAIEVQKRELHLHDGRAGESAKLTEYEVRALLGSDYEKARQHQIANAGTPHGGYWAGIVVGMENSARALRGLPPDAPSPLEGDPDG